MTDTTKPVDLSTLEQGDTIVFTDDQKAIVNHVSENYADGFSVYFSYTDNLDYQRFNDFLQNGKKQFSFNVGNDIVQLIKNPKRWTDDDIKAAFNGAILQIHKQNYVDFELWREQYKESKN